MRRRRARDEASYEVFRGAWCVPSRRWQACTYPQSPGLDPGGPVVSLRLHAVHPGEVDEEAAVDGGVSGPAVAAAADGELEAALACRVDDGCNIIGVGDPRARERPVVDALEEDLSPIVVRTSRSSIFERSSRAS